MKIIIVSACLLGMKYRYDGLSNMNFTLLELLHGKLIKPVCPEVDGGLPIPRPPAEIQNGDGFDVLEGKAKVKDNQGKDVTCFYINGARQILKGVKDVDEISFAVLKARSPACGSKNIYTGEFNGDLKPGSGVGAAFLKKRGIKVFSEEDLDEIKKIR